MKQILDDCLVILILLTLFVELYWIGGGQIETLLDDTYHSDSKTYQVVDEFH